MTPVRRGVDAEIDFYELVADGIGQPLYRWYVLLWRGMRALMDGQVEAAHAHRREAASVGARAGSHNAALNADVLAWNTLLKEGRWREAADVLARQLALADGIYGERFWVAIVTPQVHPAEAKAALDRFAADDFAELPRDAVWLAAMTYLADTCGALDYADVAEQLYAVILPHRSRFAVDAIGAACYGSMARPLGVLARVLGRRADADAHFGAPRHRRAAGAARPGAARRRPHRGDGPANRTGRREGANGAAPRCAVGRRAGRSCAGGVPDAAGRPARGTRGGGGERRPRPSGGGAHRTGRSRRRARRRLRPRWSHANTRRPG